MTAERPTRPWWARLRADTKNEPPWDTSELGHWRSRAQLERERAQRNRRANRRWLPSGRES